MQNPAAYIILVCAVVISLGLKRIVGFHKYIRGVPLIRIVLCAALLAIIFSFGFLYHPDTLIANGIGIVLGIGLASIGMRHAIIEKRDKGIYYKTHIGIEAGILIIVFFRLSTRFYQIYGSMNHIPLRNIISQLRYEKDPITGTMMSGFSTYYIVYFIYIASRAAKYRKTEAIHEPLK